MLKIIARSVYCNIYLEVIFMLKLSPYITSNRLFKHSIVYLDTSSDEEARRYEFSGY
jgi:hypothetical protein